MDELESQEQPTIELNRPSSEKSEYEDMIEDQSRAEEKMKENARRRKEMIEGEPQFKTRGPNRYDYLRGASVKALEEFYVAQGIPEKTASILVEAVGEMAQLQQNEPGLPAGASDPSRMSIDKEIGGSEGEKYKNLDVKQKQKELGLEHQDFTDFGEPVREFIQPGGEAPYSENTKDKEKAQATSDMNAKGVKQEDNAPKKSSIILSNDKAMEFDRLGDFAYGSTKDGMYAVVLNASNGQKIKEFHGETAHQDAQRHAYDLASENQRNKRDPIFGSDSKKSSASVKEASDLNLVPPEGVRSAARRGIKYHSEGKAGDGFESATLGRAKKIAEGQELTPEHVKRMHSFFERHAGGRSQKAKKGEITPWDVAWLAWGGNAGRTWAAAKVKQIENAKTSANRSDEIEEIEKEIAKLKQRGMLDGGYIYPGDDDIASDELADLHKRLKELKQ
jgi:hypothetical protein